MKELFYNPLFADALPALPDDAAKGLAQLLNEDLTSEPIIWWRNPVTDQDEVLDGHNRYRIAKRDGLPIKFHEKHFETENRALVWMLTHQASRRNCTPAPLLAKAVRLMEEDGMSKVAAIRKVAETSHVSERTVYRAAEAERKVSAVEQYRLKESELKRDLEKTKMQLQQDLLKQAETEQWDQDRYQEEAQAKEAEIQEEFAERFESLATLGETAAEEVRENPTLKQSGGKRKVKKSAEAKRDLKKHLNQSIKAMDMLNESFGYLKRLLPDGLPTACLMIQIKPAYEEIEKIIEAEAKKAKKAKFGR